MALRLQELTTLFTLKCFVILTMINMWTTCYAQQEQHNSLSQLLSSITIHFDPPNEIYVKTDEEVSVSFSVQANLSSEFGNETWTTYTGTLFNLAEPSFRFDVLPNSFQLSYNDLLDGFNTTLKIKGVLLGHAKLEFYWEDCTKQLSTTTVRTSTSVSTETTKHATDAQTIPTAVPEPNLSSDITEPPNGTADNYKIVMLTEMPSNVEEIEEDSGSTNVTVQPQATTTKKSKPRPKKHTEKRRSAVPATTAETSMLINEKKPYDDFAFIDLPSFKRERREIADTVTSSSNSVASTEKPVIKVLLLDTYKVHVLRKRGVMDTIFMIIIGIFLVVNVTMMGSAIELPIVWKVLKKPIGPAVGFVSQFAFMPLASYALGQVLLQESILQLGLFTLGCSPGGNGSNFWTLILNGDINLSITMTFISTLSAMFMMPLWLYTLGQTILSRGNIQIPFLSLITSLVTFCIPVSIGVAIRHYRPSWAEVAKKIVRPFTIILIIVANVFGLLTSTYIFKLMTWRMVVSGLCVAWGGYAFGALLAWICGLGRPQIIAVSIETAIQNAGIAFMVLALTLKEPDSDLSSVVPVAQMMVTGLPLLFCFMIYKILQIIKGCLCKKKDHQVEERKKDIDTIEPLVINRESISPPCYSKRNADDVKSSPPNVEQQRPNHVLRKRDVDTTTPIYANMYQDLGETYYENAYTKPQVQLKLSTGESKYDVPRFQMRTFDEEVESDESEENTRQSDDRIDEESNI